VSVSPASPGGQESIGSLLYVALNHRQAFRMGKRRWHPLRRAAVVINLEPTEVYRHHKRRKLFLRKRV